MWELDYKESWASKNWCFELWCWRRLLESLLDCKEIQPVHPKGNQSWILIGRTDAEGEAPILWPPDMKNWLTGKDPDADWRWEEEETTEDEMVGWHHELDGHELGWTLGGLVCCSPWGRKESDMTEWLNWTELNRFHSLVPTWEPITSPQHQQSILITSHQQLRQEGLRKPGRRCLTELPRKEPPHSLLFFMDSLYQVARKLIPGQYS